MVGVVPNRFSRICTNGNAVAMFNGGQTSVAFSSTKKIDFSGLQQTCSTFKLSKSERKREIGRSKGERQVPRIISAVSQSRMIRKLLKAFFSTSFVAEKSIHLRAQPHLNSRHKESEDEGKSDHGLIHGSDIYINSISQVGSSNGSSAKNEHEGERGILQIGRQSESEAQPDSQTAVLSSQASCLSTNKPLFRCDATS